MKKVWVILFIFALGWSLVACSSDSTTTSSKSSKAELTLVWSKNEASDEQLTNILAEFNKQNPDITVKRVEVVSSGWADYFNKIQTMIAGGKSPDVIRVAIEGIQMFAKQDLLLPLDTYMKADPAALDNYSDLHPKLQSPFVIDKKTYGFVWDWNNVVMHFNTDMLKQAGLTMPNKMDEGRFSPICAEVNHGKRRQEAIRICDSKLLFRSFRLVVQQ
jgi:multiple sugar transport system substrate-binding protein